MVLHLVPCPACQRHVRVSEQACPFCTQPLAESLRSSTVGPMPTARLGRAALHAFRASLTGIAVVAVGGVALAGSVACSSDSDNGSTGQQTSGGTSAGGNNGTGGSAAGANAGGNEGLGFGGDNGGAVALYGAVPVDPVDDVDAGAGGDAGSDDQGGFVPIYGAPTIPAVPS